MKITEEQKLSLEAGEFIHGIANLLVEEVITIDNVSSQHAELIMEISESLRKPDTRNASAPRLLSVGFPIEEYQRSAWIDLACRLLSADKETPISDIIMLIDN